MSFNPKIYRFTLNGVDYRAHEMEEDSKTYLVARYDIESEPQTVEVIIEANSKEELEIALQKRFGKIEYLNKL